MTNIDIFSATTVIITLKVERPEDQHLTQKSQLALDFMIRMRDRGMELASDCLRLVEKYQMKPSNSNTVASEANNEIPLTGGTDHDPSGCVAMPLTDLLPRQEDSSSRTIDPWLLDLSHPWNAFDEEFIKGGQMRS